MTYQNLWYLMLGIIVAVYLAVLLRTKDKRYLFYFIAGAAVGFYLDIVSVSQGYYTYHQYFPSVLGVPLSVTVAEGSSVAVTIFLYKEIISKIVSKLVKK